ncbi:pilus assembly protein PilM [bacterium]|nr:pilus assembly protein PilM [bacterium]
MFNDKDHIIEESENPASMLLMGIIKSQSKESKESLKDETGFENSISEPSEIALEHFMADHESVILKQDSIEPEKDRIGSVPEDVDLWAGVDPDSMNAQRLHWWEKLFAKSTIGIEINPRIIRAAKVKSWGSKHETVQLEEVEVEESHKSDILIMAQLVKQVLQKLKANNTPITSIIGGSDVNLRLLRMPKVSKKEIHEALLWKNKKELHFFNDAPTVLHYIILDEDQSPNANEFYVLVIAVKEELIKSNLEIVERAKALPSKLTIRPIAQWNFMKQIPDKEGNSLLIDVGFESSHLTFYRNNTLQFARELPVGGNHFTKALMQTIFVDDTSYLLSWDEAESIKKDIGLPFEPLSGITPQGIPYSEIAVMMRPVAEKLASEILMSLDYYKENFKVTTYDNVYFTGNTIFLKRLKPFLESAIGQPIRPLRLNQAIALPSTMDKENISALSMDTIGAAMSAGKDLNFLPPKQKKELTFRNAYSKTYSALLIVLGILVGSLLFLNKKHKNMEQILSILNTSLNHVQNENREYEKLQNEKKALNITAAKISEETRVDPSALGILKWLSGITPEAIAIEQLSWGNAFSEIELRRTATNQAMKSNGSQASNSTNDGKELRIKGVVYRDVFYADVHLLNFLSAIEKTGFFTDVQLKEKQRDEIDGSLSFVLIAKKK